MFYVFFVVFIETEINLPFLSADETGPKHLSHTLTRAQFEQMTLQFINKTFEPVDLALSDAQLEVEDITDVVLVGGMTRMPKIQQMLRDVTILLAFFFFFLIICPAYKEKLSEFSKLLGQKNYFWENPLIEKPKISFFFGKKISLLALKVLRRKMLIFFWGGGGGVFQNIFNGNWAENVFVAKSECFDYYFCV